ncbi:nuclear respiratory factor 1 [Manacus vitellinus]|uniref:nuclear respiratory factor 1 n=1 Tax=Manacus vitellinus TaxID=328815 RepID=UPI00115EA21C|nr:nuclear respiratory factor 1 [Manacus vitellinus]
MVWGHYARNGHRPRPQQWIGREADASASDWSKDCPSAAGPVGMAAAAAVATGKKRKRPHVFESNPSIRKRQQTRLLRKLRATLDEYTTRVGQQAIVLCISPSKPNPVFKVFGAAPLENVRKDPKNSPLCCGLLQAQLRAFIPEMLKYSTGRGKPGWGKESCKPIWWPEDIPWANVRSDVRTEEQKQRVEQNWATLQGGEMTIQTTQASEATQAVASLAEAAVAASQEMQQGATVTMALNSEAAAHAVATLAEATLQGGGQIVLSGETAAAVGALTGVQDANGKVEPNESLAAWQSADQLACAEEDRKERVKLVVGPSWWEQNFLMKVYPETGRIYSRCEGRVRKIRLGRCVSEERVGKRLAAKEER